MRSVNVNDIVQTVFTFTGEIKVLETQQILVRTLKNVLRRTELEATALLLNSTDLHVTPDHEQTTGCHKMLSFLQCSTGVLGTFHFFISVMWLTHSEKEIISYTGLYAEAS